MSGRKGKPRQNYTIPFPPLSPALFPFSPISPFYPFSPFFKPISFLLSLFPFLSLLSLFGLAVAPPDEAEPLGFLFLLYAASRHHNTEPLPLRLCPRFGLIFSFSVMFSCQSHAVFVRHRAFFLHSLQKRHL